jgi:hypothetical protein
MSGLRSIFHLDSDFVLLQANAEQAGRALACSYSSSDEFEAAIITARRAAGRYGRPRRQQLFAASLLILVVAGTFLFT